MMEVLQDPSFECIVFCIYAALNMVIDTSWIEGKALLSTTACQVPVNLKSTERNKIKMLLHLERICATIGVSKALEGY